MAFFLRYLIQSRVFPESEYKDRLECALSIVQLARSELPNSFDMGHALPDSFSRGCKEVWGSMHHMWPVTLVSTDESKAERQGWGDPPSPIGGGWGTADGGGDEDGWGLPAFAPTDGEGAIHQLAPPHWDSDAPATWGAVAPTLLPLLGVSTFPLTHTTGIVEHSTRRIVRVDPARAPRRLARNVLPAEAVEEDLACRFARLVLAPWERLDGRKYEQGPDVLPPRILSTSRGVVVVEDGKEEGESVDGVHHPWKNVIAVLVDPKLADILVAGMGLGATWVEIVRVEGSYAVSEKGKGVNKEVPKYWYMEELVQQLPSFYSYMSS